MRFRDLIENAVFSNISENHIDVYVIIFRYKPEYRDAFHSVYGFYADYRGRPQPVDSYLVLLSVYVNRSLNFTLELIISPSLRIEI